jgi:hypothetical protein
MKRHPFDPLAFIFGLLFLAVGIPMMFIESGFVLFEGKWIIPVLLIIAGGVVLVSSRKSTRDGELVLSEQAVDSDLQTMIDNADKMTD